MSRDDYEFELSGDRERIAAALAGVADGVLAGSVRLDDGEDPIAVDVPDALELEVEFEVDDDESELELELEWETPAEGAGVSPADPLPGDGGNDESGPESGDGADDAAHDGAGEAAEDGPATGEDESEASATGEDGEEATGEDDPIPEADPVEADPVEADPVESVPVGAADPLASLARFEVYRDRADEWRWRLRHRNGNVIATGGQGYTRKHNALKGLRSVMKNSPEAEVVDR